MNICLCTLPSLYGKDICKKCPVYVGTDSEGTKRGSVSALDTWKSDIEEFRNRKTRHPYGIWTIKTKKTTEKYDCNGNLIEKIIEEGNG